MVFHRLILLISFFAGLLAPGQEVSPPIRLTTYNIWYDNPGNQGNAWSDRVDGVLETLDELEPGVLCVQEALHHQLEDIQSAGFSSFGVGRDDGLDAGEFTAILYRPELFNLLDGGTFWLSETPDSPGSLGWDAVLPRIATWVKLEDRKSGKAFFVVNTHLSHVGETARLESVKLILAKAGKISGNAPLIICGDFNFKPGSEPYAYLTRENEAFTFYDSRALSPSHPDDPGFSFAGADFMGTPGNIIDHIFTSGGIDVSTSRIFNNCKKGRCPSDHLPVVLEFSLRQQP